MAESLAEVTGAIPFVAIAILLIVVHGTDRLAEREIPLVRVSVPGQRGTVNGGRAVSAHP